MQLMSCTEDFPQLEEHILRRRRVQVHVHHLILTTTAITTTCHQLVCHHKHVKPTAALTAGIAEVIQQLVEVPEVE